MKHKAVMSFAQGKTTSKRQSQDSKTENVLLITALPLLLQE